MKYIIGFLIGAAAAAATPTTLVGYTLYGGAISSSALASVYGYGDDMDGCNQIAACMNFAQNKQMLTGTFSEKWSGNGLHYCK